MTPENITTLLETLAKAGTGVTDVAFWYIAAEFGHSLLIFIFALTAVFVGARTILVCSRLDDTKAVLASMVESLDGSDDTYYDRRDILDLAETASRLLKRLEEKRDRTEVLLRSQANDMAGELGKKRDEIEALQRVAESRAEFIKELGERVADAQERRATTKRGRTK